MKHLKNTSTRPAEQLMTKQILKKSPKINSSKYCLLKEIALPRGTSYTHLNKTNSFHMFAYLDTYSQAHYGQFKRINENLSVRSGYEDLLNCIVI